MRPAWLRSASADVYKGDSRNPHNSSGLVVQTHASTCCKGINWGRSKWERFAASPRIFNTSFGMKGQRSESHWQGWEASCHRMLASTYANMKICEMCSRASLAQRAALSYFKPVSCGKYRLSVLLCYRQGCFLGRRREWNNHYYV